MGFLKVKISPPRLSTGANWSKLLKGESQEGEIDAVANKHRMNTETAYFTDVEWEIVKEQHLVEGKARLLGESMEEIYAERGSLRLKVFCLGYRVYLYVIEVLVPSEELYQLVTHSWGTCPTDGTTLASQPTNSSAHIIVNMNLHRGDA